MGWEWEARPESVPGQKDSGYLPSTALTEPTLRNVKAEKG